MPFTDASLLVDEIVVLPRVGDVVITRPRSPESFIDLEAFDTDEYMPYWAELWPSGVALARAVAEREWRGARVLELGCGLGVPSIAAALSGARVVATDWAEDALEVLASNARAAGVAVEVLHADWREPATLVERGPFDAVLAADVLYEERNVAVLLDLLPRLVRPGHEVWLTDPGRGTAEPFFEALAPAWSSTATRVGPNDVTLHRLRLQE